MLRFVLFLLACSPFLQANAQWNHIPAPVEADIQAMSNDGDSVLYVLVSDGSIYRTNNGSIWRKLGNIPVSLSFFSPIFKVSAGTIYLSDGELHLNRITNFIRSDNEGTTLESTLPGVTFSSLLSDFEADGTVLYASTRMNTLHYSADKGKNWQLLPYQSLQGSIPRSICKLGNLLWLSDDNGIYYSNNQGQSFEQLETNVPSGVKFVQTGERLYALSYSGLYQWLDMPGEFTDLGSGNLNLEEVELSNNSNFQVSHQGQLAFNHSNAYNCSVAWYYSGNNGQYWHLIAASENNSKKYKIGQFFQKNLWLGGSEGLHYVEIEQDTNFNLTPVPLNDFKIEGFAIHDQNILTWTGKNHYLHQNNTWVPDNPSSVESICYKNWRIYSTTARTWFPKNKLVFDDLSSRWQSYDEYPNGAWLDSLGYFIEMNVLDNGFLFATNNSVWWWSDRASQPRYIEPITYFGEEIISTYPTAGGKGFITQGLEETTFRYSLFDENGDFVKNLDLGVPCGSSSLGNNFVYSDGRNVFRFCSDEILLLTLEASDWEQWNPMDWATGVPIRFQTINFFKEHEGVYYLGTMNGLYYATDLSGRFYPFPQPVPNPYLKAMRIKDHTLWIATYTDGFYSLNLEEQKTAYSQQGFRIINQPSASGSPLRLQSLEPCPQGITIRLVDLSGRLLLERDVAGVNDFEVAVPALVAGTYVVQVRSGQRLDVLKWIVGR
jgi:hypothetical protein